MMFIHFNISRNLRDTNLDMLHNCVSSFEDNIDCYKSVFQKYLGSFTKILKIILYII